VVVNAEKEDNERKRKRKTLLGEKKEVISPIWIQVSEFATYQASGITSVGC
jgi:hypothetical protein